MMLFVVMIVGSLLVVQAQGSTSEMQATPYASYYVAECQGCCNDIRLYGLLKSIGTTPVQIYVIVMVQAVILCIVAVPLGMGLAAALSLVFVPMVLQILAVQTTLVVSLSPMIFIGAAILAVLTTLLGSLSPAKKAARISPIEATRYTEQELNKKRALFPTKGSPFLLAIRNIFFRNKNAWQRFSSACFSVVSYL